MWGGSVSRESATPPSLGAGWPMQRYHIYWAPNTHVIVWQRNLSLQCDETKWSVDLTIYRSTTFPDPRGRPQWTKHILWPHYVCSTSVAEMNADAQSFVEADFVFLSQNLSFYPIFDLLLFYTTRTTGTSCRRAAAKICPRPSPPSMGASRRRANRACRPQRSSRFPGQGQYVPTVTAATAWRVNAAVSKAAWWPWPLTLKVVPESRVMWATYLCANFSLPRPLCSRLWSDVRDRQTSDRRQTASSLNAPALLWAAV